MFGKIWDYIYSLFGWETKQYEDLVITDVCDEPFSKNVPKEEYSYEI